MSGTWETAADALTLVGLAVVAIGLIVRTVGDASIQMRGRTKAVGFGLCVVGMCAVVTLLSIKSGDPWLAAGAVLGVALFAPGFFVGNRLTLRLSQVGILMMFGVQGRAAWLKDDLAQFVWMLTIVVGIIVALVLFVWVRAKFQKPKLRRDAHA